MDTTSTIVHSSTSKVDLLHNCSTLEHTTDKYGGNKEQSMNSIGAREDTNEAQSQPLCQETSVTLLPPFTGMATEKLSTWISTLTYADLPSPVIEATLKSFQNSLGCIIGGSHHTATLRAIQALVSSPPSQISSTNSINLEPRNSNSEATAQILGHSSLLTTPDLATLINGIASHVHDYDDTHLETVIHPAGAILSALLSLISPTSTSASDATPIQSSSVAISGQRFLLALAVGLETSLRLGLSISPAHYSHGWHITSTAAPLAVAAALSNLWSLDVNQTIHALGIAASQPVGIRTQFGSDTKAFHVGRAAQNGLLAAKLARGGFTASEEALEGRRGWVEILGMGCGNEKLDRLVGELVDDTERARQTATSQNDARLKWELEKNTFKPFPCGIVIHPIIDACIQLHGEHFSEGHKSPYRIEDIKSIALEVHPLVLDLTGKREPKDSLSAKFSVYHGAAIGLLLGCGSPAEYDGSIVRDPSVVEVRDKVTATADKGIRSDECNVKILFQDGREVEKHIDHAIGSLEKPLGRDQLKKKFIEQCKDVLGEEGATRLEAMAWDVRGTQDLSTLVAACVPSGGGIVDDKR